MLFNSFSKGTYKSNRSKMIHSDVSTLTMNKMVKIDYNGTLRMEVGIILTREFWCMLMTPTNSIKVREQDIIIQTRHIISVTSSSLDHVSFYHSLQKVSASNVGKYRQI